VSLPHILALDTTHEFGSIALAGPNGLIEEVLLHAPEGFGQIIFDRIGALLDRHGLTPVDIGLYAAASGPGSFTGVRIGLACVKGLAEATGKPVTGVSNLEALAEFGTLSRRATIIDARRGEVYAALFGEPALPEAVLKFPEFLQRLPPGEMEFIATDFAPFLPALSGTRFAEATITTAPRAQASAIASIARRRYGAGDVQDPAAIDANYVRRSDAEIFWTTPRPLSPPHK
jgi:tRNA threonylcarbamoyladenosine biosynthesis protein TsaB